MDYSLLRDVVEREVKFPERDWELFTSFIEPLDLSKKEFLFREGEVLRHLAFVNRGCLRYYLTDTQGEERIVYFGFEGWWIGDMNSFFMQQPTIYFMQALEDCQLFLFNLENFQRAIDETVYGTVFRKLTGRSYTAIQQRFAEANLISAEERYAKLLKSHPQIFQRVPQHYIASYLGIKPESLSRIRKNLSKG